MEFPMRLHTRGPVEGPCNLCGEFARLTEDHIPPKGVPRVGQARLVELDDFVRGQKASSSSRLFKNGVQYRSICATCNNARLGARYDPELIAFTRQLDEQLPKFRYLPMTLTLRPDRLVRSVLGHLLAHTVDMPEEGEVFVDLKAYFMDEAARLPAGYQLWCWPYPFNDQLVIQAMGRMTGLGREFLTMSLIKFYPVGFILLKGEWTASRPALTRLDHLLTGDLDAQATLTLPRSGLAPRGFPESPDDDGAVMLNTQMARGAFRI